MIFLEPPFFFWGSVGERLDAPGVLHHVTGRGGIEWRKILIDAFLARGEGIRVFWSRGCALSGGNDIMSEPGCFLWTKAKERKLHLKATHFLHQRIQTRKLEQGPLGPNKP
jgi:hypothetical protein